jgi:hypothetical protein
MQTFTSLSLGCTAISKVNEHARNRLFQKKLLEKQNILAISKTKGADSRQQRDKTKIPIQLDFSNLLQTN